MSVSNIPMPNLIKSLKYLTMQLYLWVRAEVPFWIKFFSWWLLKGIGWLFCVASGHPKSIFQNLANCIFGLLENYLGQKKISLLCRELETNDLILYVFNYGLLNFYISKIFLTLSAVFFDLTKNWKLDTQEIFRYAHLT